MKAFNELYVFVHIPKTAGEVFKRNIEDSLSKEKFIRTSFEHAEPYYDLNIKKTQFYSGKTNFINYINTLSHSQKQNVECIAGHDAYYGIHNLFPKTPRYVTFLRDPILRTISLYNYERMAWDLYSKKNQTLSIFQAQFLKRMQTHFLINNQVPEFEEWLLQVYNHNFPFYFTMTDYLKYLGFLEGEITQESLTQACEKFHYVGITEQYEEDSSYLYGLLNVHKAAADKNASPPYITLDKLSYTIIEKIKEINHFDMLLYQAAKEQNQEFKSRNKEFYNIVKKMDSIKKEREIWGNNFVLPPNNTIADFTGERFIPGVTGEIESKHIHRYLFATTFCKNKIVLDIASGEGYGAFVLSQTAEKVIGVEIDPDSVKQANKLYASSKIEFRQGNCQKIPLTDKSVDRVTSFETLEHFIEHDEFLREIKRILRPEGLLILSTPDRDIFSNGEPSKNPYHLKELNLNELSILIHTYFKEVQLLGQRYYTGSTIQTINDPYSNHSFTHKNLYFTRNGNRVETNDSLNQMTNVIVLASDVKIPTHLVYESFFESQDPLSTQGAVTPNTIYQKKIQILKVKLREYPMLYRLLYRMKCWFYH